jgi:hypothetical protein
LVAIKRKVHLADLSVNGRIIMDNKMDIEEREGKCVDWVMKILIP